MSKNEIRNDVEIVSLEKECFDFGDQLMLLFTLVLFGVFILATYFTKMGVI